MSKPQHVDKAARAERLLAQIRAVEEEIQAVMKRPETSWDFLEMLCDEQWQLLQKYKALRWQKGGA